MTFLYVFRDSPTRQLADDVDWAIVRFLHRFDKEPSELLVNPEEENDFIKLDAKLKIKSDKTVGKGYFGVV